MSKSCVIFAGGDPVKAQTVDRELCESSLVICADRGYDLAESLGIAADLIMGDFDSAKARPLGENVIAFKPEKDDTDLMLALKEGLRQGCDDFTLYGACGGRLDHMIGNIQGLRYLAQRGARGRIVSDNDIITVLKPGKYEFFRKEGWSLSFFALSDTAQGFTVGGVKYEAHGITLSADIPLGISNEIIGEKAVMSFSRGIIAAVESNLL